MSLCNQLQELHCRILKIEVVSADLFHDAPGNSHTSERADEKSADPVALVILHGAFVRNRETTLRLDLVPPHERSQDIRPLCVQVLHQARAPVRLHTNSTCLQ